MNEAFTKKLSQLKQALDQGIIDADTYAEPDLVRVAVPHAEARGAELFSMNPFQLLASPGERAVLPHELRLAAARQAVHSLYESELRRRGAYRDYRQHTARLCALEVPKAEELVQLSLR